ncbi:MAG: YaeQ family protein [Aeromonadaceae bacterium]|nr:YaeQ family protein [Aeromonadaceae bacterium]
MALKATIFKVNLNVADTDRGVYLQCPLTLARHPSETDERMMVRLLAWALNADERLEFTKGLCADDEPELWLKSYAGEIEHWIEVGLPDERRLKKACHRAKQVTLYAYGGRAVSVWWQQNSQALQRYDNLTIIELASDSSQQLAAAAQRAMECQVTITDGDVWFACGDTDLQLCWTRRYPV